MTHMDTLTLEIPREIAQALRLPPQDRESRLRLELAVALYSQNILGGGKAADLAGLPLLRFNEELESRRVPMHYDESDLAQDAAYGRAR
jgi:predicted HTH domain antitoxin